MTGDKRLIKPYPLGAHIEADGALRFAFVSTKTNCGILIFDRQTGKRIKKIPFTKDERIGNIYCKYLEDLNPEEITYQFYDEDRIVPDPRARVFVGKHIYGRERSAKELKAGFLNCEYDWEGDKRPHISYEDSVLYCMHVRGFTRHRSSGVKHRGTFSGVTEKIPYLKETGITTVELQPAYEFCEMPDNEERRRAFTGSSTVSDEDLDKYYPKKLNYWGYKQGYYYAPKSAYAFGEDASLEFKEMVKGFHRENMEVIMQFYFPEGMGYSEIFDILHFWVINYHVDGFHLMGDRIPTFELAKDSALADTKLMYYGFDTDNIYPKDEGIRERTLAEYNDAYLYDMRKFLKGDEGTVGKAVTHMAYNPEKSGVINYFTNYYGLTMMDMVSYDRKHNEANGEENRDGNDYNCSWNCGEEGMSRKKRIQLLRKKLIKNAYTMLLFSQGTPLIFMGDEFGNSQGGNNNPYCQDNAVTWLDWSRLEVNRELYDYWKMLVNFRKAHRILHAPKMLSLVDSLSCGYPALSYHGQNAWKAQLENYNRHVGMMYCGKYAADKKDGEDAFLYLAMNMYWEERELALPKIPKNLMWKCVIDTSGEQAKEHSGDSTDEDSFGEALEQANSTDSIRTIPQRSIMVFIGVERGAAPVSGKRKRKR